MRTHHSSVPTTAYPHKTPESSLTDLDWVTMTWGDPRAVNSMVLHSSQVKEIGGCKAHKAERGLGWFSSMLVYMCESVYPVL